MTNHRSRGRLNKSEAGYVNNAARRHCEDCAMWLAWGGCSLVEGSIQRHGTCSEWEARTDRRGPKPA